MITLTQAERLVRKIAEVVGHPASDTQTAKLAQDYADLCRDANRRLEQCALMIDAGQFLQTLQLAETPPPLLDLITVLSFRQAAEWRAYCQGHQLPWTEPFYDKYVRLLNSTYNKGIAGDHPFYRDYRRAVMNNEDDRAISILRVIARLNPSDENTRQELKRLEEKLLRGKLDHLRQTLAKGDSDAAQAQLAQIETSGLPIPSSHPVWQQAQVARCQQLLRRAEQLRQRDAWQDAEILIEEIHSFATQYNVQMPAADADSWTALDSWTAEKRAAYAEDQDFQRAVSALEYEVQTTESRQAGGARPGIKEAADLCNSLAAKWREAERFNRPLDAALTQRCEQSNGWLQQQIKTAGRKKRIFAIAITLLALGAIGAAIPLGMDWFRQRDFLRRLGTLESSRRVADTEALLAGIPPPLQSKAPMAEGLAKARSFLEREKELKRTFDEDWSVLQRLAAGGFQTNSDQTGALRQQCGSAEDKLAPEFQPPAKSNLLAWDGQWQDFCNKEISNRLARAEQMAAAVRASQSNLISSNLDRAGQIAAVLQGTNGYEVVHAALPGLQSALAEMEPYKTNWAALDPNLQNRYLEASNQFALWKRIAEQWEQAQASLAGAQSLDDYLNSLDRVAQSPFARPAQRDGAAEMDRLKLNQAAFLGELLLPNQRARWGTLTNLAGWRTNLVPETPTDEERVLCVKLKNDGNMQNVYAYDLVAFPRTNNPFRSHVVFVQGSIAPAGIGHNAGLVYDPYTSPNAALFVRTSFDDLYYSDVRKRALLQECDAFDHLGLGELIDPNTGNYKKPILRLLDQLNRETNSSGEFRAVVSLELFALAGLRPEEWGMPWCPAAAQHLQALTNLGATDLKSGDWMAPSKLPLEEPLRKYFLRARGIPLENQARFLQQLVRETCRAGFSLAGYVDGDGRPVLRQISSSATDYWGWGSRLPVSAVLLFRKTAGAAAPVKMAEPLPFTPLFVFRGDPRNLLEEAAQAASFPASQAAAILPPFFVQSHE
jgi:hypothetical protein